jgi:hypothetical protein
VIPEPARPLLGGTRDSLPEAPAFVRMDSTARSERMRDDQFHS